MSTINDPTTTANIQRVGPVDTAVAQMPAHVSLRPVAHGVLGHYSASLRIASTAVQVANARILALRNTHASNLLVLTGLRLRALQTAAGTAQENALDVYKATSFTVIDTTNTITPTVSKRRAGMANAPGNAEIRALSPNVAGMTGGTLTKDSLPFASLPYNVAAAIGSSMWGPIEAAEDAGSVHPFVFAQNEGLVVENRTLNVTSYGITWYLDLSWAEVSAF